MQKNALEKEKHDSCWSGTQGTASFCIIVVAFHLEKGLQTHPQRPPAPGAIFPRGAPFPSPLLSLPLSPGAPPLRPVALPEPPGAGLGRAVLPSPGELPRRRRRRRRRQRRRLSPARPGPAAPRQVSGAARRRLPAGCGGTRGPPGSTGWRWRCWARSRPRSPGCSLRLWLGRGGGPGCLLPAPRPRRSHGKAGTPLKRGREEAAAHPPLHLPYCTCPLLQALCSCFMSLLMEASSCRRRGCWAQQGDWFLGESVMLLRNSCVICTTAI